MYMKGIIHHGLVCLFDPKKKKEYSVDTWFTSSMPRFGVCMCVCAHVCVRTLS